MSGWEGYFLMIIPRLCLKVRTDTLILTLKAYEGASPIVPIDRLSTLISSSSSSSRAAAIHLLLGLTAPSVVPANTSIILESTCSPADRFSNVSDQGWLSSPAWVKSNTPASLKWRCGCTLSSKPLAPCWRLSCVDSSKQKKRRKLKRKNCQFFSLLRHRH